MGQNSACCNPTSHLPEPELPKDVFTVEPLTELPQEFVEPSEEVVATLRRGEEYLSSRFGRGVALESEDLWHLGGRREGR